MRRAYNTLGDLRAPGMPGAFGDRGSPKRLAESTGRRRVDRQPRGMENLFIGRRPDVERLDRIDIAGEGDTKGFSANRGATSSRRAHNRQSPTTTRRCNARKLRRITRLDHDGGALIDKTAMHTSTKISI